MPTLRKYGTHGRTVRVTTETLRGTKLVRVQWREAGRRRTESWPDTKENRRLAIAFAETTSHRIAHRIAEPPPPIAISVLYAKYVSANTHWRPATRVVNDGRWKRFVVYAGPGRPAHELTPDLIDQYRAAMKRQGYAGNQVAEHVKVVKAVCRFARQRRLLAENPLADYVVKTPKEDRSKPIPEYTPQEARALLAKCDARDPRSWRLYVALHVFALAGPRQNAARHLTWDDIDLAAHTVRWRPELDKVGYDRTQLLPAQVVEALWVAYGWRIAYGYTGPLVFFRPGAGTIDTGGWHTHRKGPTQRSLRRAAAKPDVPWTYAALNGALRRLEDAAGVEHVPQRAAHGMRRFVVTEVHAATGNLALAGQYVGDRDLRTLARSYLRERPEEQRRAVEHMERAMTRALDRAADLAANDTQTTTAALREAAEGELGASIAP